MSPIRDHSRSGAARSGRTGGAARRGAVRTAPSRRGRSSPTTTMYRGRAMAKSSKRASARLWTVAVVGFGFLAVIAGIGFSGVGGRLFGQLGRLVSDLEIGRASVEVRGNQYLAAAEVREASGLAERVSFWQSDLDSARALLLEHPRVQSANVSRRFNGKIVIEIEERSAIALVQHGKLREIDRDGVLLPALLRGSLPDLPLLRGLDEAEDGRVTDRDLDRALDWLRALSEPRIGLAERISEIDVSSTRETGVVLSPAGTQLLLPRDPDELISLSAIRVVLADLASKELEAMLIDCRARGMAVVKPSPGGAKRYRESRLQRETESPSGSAGTL